MLKIAFLATLNLVMSTAFASGEPPKFESIYEATVDIAPGQSLGEGAFGERRIVPILGGKFIGEHISGIIVPGGADRQLVRKDGAKELEALYEMRTDDGVIISVKNEAILMGEGPSRYAFSRLTFAAPNGKYDWLNKSLFIGTVTSLRPARDAVSIKVYRVY